MSAGSYYGGIELGGTKIVCAAGHGPESIISYKTFKTTSNADGVLRDIVDWFNSVQSVNGEMIALGVASFGPLDLNMKSPTYGRIMKTPKVGWQNFDILKNLSEGLPGVPVFITTDTNGAVLAEAKWGAAKGLKNVVYVGLGTGIGAGVLVNGSILNCSGHTEIGHMLLPRRSGDLFPGSCKFHGACWEGMCSGAALRARTGQDPSGLPSDHPVWVYQAEYCGVALANLVLSFAPERIIVGGGAANAGGQGREEFLSRVRKRTLEHLGGYLDLPILTLGAIDRFIVQPAFADIAGVLGAISYAAMADQHTTSA